MAGPDRKTDDLGRKPTAGVARRLIALQWSFSLLPKLTNAASNFRDTTERSRTISKFTLRVPNSLKNRQSASLTKIDPVCLDGRGPIVDTTRTRRDSRYLNEKRPIRKLVGQHAVRSACG
jgi:hypothetical protein